MNFVEFFAWLASSSGAAIVISWLFERWPFYQTLEPKVKEVVFNFSAAVVTGLAALVLFYMPPEWLVYVNPAFAALYVIVGALIAGEKFHLFDKK